MAKKSDGLTLRKGATKDTWWLEFVFQGHRHRVRIGSGISRTVAREIAAVKRAAILKGEAGIGAKKRKDISFEKAVEEFLAWAKANRRPKTWKTYKNETKALMVSFKGKNLSEIHPFLIEKHKQSRIQADAKVSANRELTCLKNIFNRCLEWRKFEGENPAESVKTTREPKNRLRFLSHEEARLLSASSEPLRTIILIGIHAGLRIQAEALTLRWESVDLDRRLVTVEAAYAKNGETRTVPMNTIVWEALRRLKSDGVKTEMVFNSGRGTHFKSIRTAFTTACRNAKVSDVSPHVLRHTFGSRLAMAGVDLRTIQELGGWKDIKMVERYAHLSPSHKAAAVERTCQTAQNSPTGVPTQDTALAVNH